MTKSAYFQQALNYWFDSAADDWDTALKLQKSQKYHHALFFGHLSLEKLFKGKFVELKNDYPLPVHDLVKLAKKIEIKLDEQQQIELKEITGFNLEARYDSYKLKFYQKATSEFCQKWLKTIERWRRWLQTYKK